MGAREPLHARLVVVPGPPVLGVLRDDHRGRVARRHRRRGVLAPVAAAQDGDVGAPRRARHLRPRVRVRVRDAPAALYPPARRPSERRRPLALPRIAGDVHTQHPRGAVDRRHRAPAEQPVNRRRLRARDVPRAHTLGGALQAPDDQPHAPEPRIALAVLAERAGVGARAGDRRVGRRHAPRLPVPREGDR